MDIILVKCLGCGTITLGGTGRDDDPLIDVTYQEKIDDGEGWDGAVWICDQCYESPVKRNLN